MNLFDPGGHGSRLPFALCIAAVALLAVLAAVLDLQLILPHG